MKLEEAYKKGSGYDGLDCTQIVHKLMQVEYDSVFKYLNLMKCCDDLRYIHLTSLYYKYAMEEESHYKKHVDYLIDLKKPVFVPTPVSLPCIVMSCDEIFMASLSHEMFVTENYNMAMKRALEINDHMLHEHLGWYLAEQKEELSKFNDWIDFASMLGDSPQKRYEIDKLAQEKL